MADKYHPFGQNIAIKAPPPAKIPVSPAQSKLKVPEPAPAPEPEAEPIVVPKFTCPTCGTKLDACPVCKH